MLFSRAGFSGPVKISCKDSETVVLDCDRSYRWPTAFGIGGLILVCFGVWLPELNSIFFGSLSALAALIFALQRPRIVLSSETSSLHLLRRSWLPWKWRVSSSIHFSEIQEFLVEAEFDAAINKPFVWHLIVMNKANHRVPLTWHFFRRPVVEAAQQAARVSRKSFREQPNPFASERWNRWWVNFMR